MSKNISNKVLRMKFMKSGPGEESKSTHSKSKNSEFWSLEHLYTNVKPKPEPSEDEPVLASRMSFGSFSIEPSESTKRKRSEGEPAPSSKKAKLAQDSE